MTRPQLASPLSMVDGSPWRLSMGLHRLDPNEWLEVDERRAEELHAKAALLDRDRADVLVTLPEGDAASRELLGLVVTDVTSLHDLVEASGTLLTDRRTTLVVDTARAHPVEAAARLVQEDLCVLVRDDLAWRLVAGCVCFPSRWSLREKLGATVAEIHRRVPGFDEALARPTATVFDRLRVERPVWRLNWTLLDTPELHVGPGARGRDLVGTADLGDALWFRVERQTLRRLERTGAIVFTIRTTVRPLEEVVAATFGFADALRRTLATVDEDVARYKGWTSLLAPLLEWLGARAHAEPAQ